MSIGAVGIEETVDRQPARAEVVLGGVADAPARCRCRAKHTRGSCRSPRTAGGPAPPTSRRPTSRCAAFRRRGRRPRDRREPNGDRYGEQRAGLLMHHGGRDEIDRHPDDTHAVRLVDDRHGCRGETRDVGECRANVGSSGAVGVTAQEVGSVGRQSSTGGGAGTAGPDSSSASPPARPVVAGRDSPGCVAAISTVDPSLASTHPVKVVPHRPLVARRLLRIKYDRDASLALWSARRLILLAGSATRRREQRG
jgi:hypothetical protein